jgi:hypothetical protein
MFLAQLGRYLPERTAARRATVIEFDILRLINVLIQTGGRAPAVRPRRARGGLSVSVLLEQ